MNNNRRKETIYRQMNNAKTRNQLQRVWAAVINGNDGFDRYDIAYFRNCHDINLERLLRSEAARN